MKIYKVRFDLSLVLSRLKHIRLREFNSERPLIFVEAENPDEACYKTYHQFAEILLKEDHRLVKEIKDIFNDITITKIETP
jgi:hypothetical protein|tara:strand:- start:360 stop:602 length:243 start_codon:yes stop_codon:yes gene_type:complete